MELSIESPWLQKNRRTALERFETLGYPTEKLEDWRFTNVDQIKEGGFKPNPLARMIAVPKTLDAMFPVNAFACRLVFINGRYSSPDSSLPSATSPLTVCPFSTMSEADSRCLERTTDISNVQAERPFTNLNAALFSDGVFCRIAPHAILQKPIAILYLTHPALPDLAVHPRILIVAEPGSQSVVMETFWGDGSQPYFTNAVTEIIVNENAFVEHVRVQNEDKSAFHIGALFSTQKGNSRFLSHVFALGGKLARNEIYSALNAQGAVCGLNGLYLGTGRQHMDNHTTIDHVGAHCASNELYKGVLSGNARGVFNGRIIVRPQAQKTDAVQRNKNLLLSNTALVNTKPELKIYADDVKCKHGATIGRMDPDQIFYLRSRGLAAEDAKSILVYAFISDMIEKIESIELKNLVESIVRASYIDNRKWQ